MAEHNEQFTRVTIEKISACAGYKHKGKQAKEQDNEDSDAQIANKSAKESASKTNAECHKRTNDY